MVQCVLTRFRHVLPSACQHSTVRGPKREYWLGVSGLPAVYLLSAAARNLKGGADKFSWTGLFVDSDLFSSLIPLHHSNLHPGRKQLLWNTRPASSAHQLSALSEKTATKAEVVLDIFLSIHQCVWVILQSTKLLVWSLFLHMCSTSMKTPLLFNLYIFTLLLSSPLSPSSLRCLHNGHIEFVTGPKSYFHFALGK